MIRRPYIQLKGKDIPKIRKRLLKKQKGVCAICGTIPQTPCLDHQHKKRIKGTGKIRGVLCAPCNIFIAKSENNAIRYGVKQKNLSKRLRQFADYLDKKQYPFIHPSEAPKIQKLKKISYNKLRTFFKNKNKNKFPDYPKSGTLIKPLKLLFEEAKIQPEFYKN